MIDGNHIGHQAVEAYAAERGEAAAIVPLEKLFNDPDAMLAKKRIAKLKHARLSQTVQQFEQRVLDPEGLEMRLDCMIPLDMFMHDLLHEGGDYWDDESVLRDYRKYNPTFVFREPKRSNFTGWRGADRSVRAPFEIVLTDKRGNVA